MAGEDPRPSQDEMLAILGALDLFEMLPYARLQFVLGMGRLRRMKQGEYLFRPGGRPLLESEDTPDCRAPGDG